MFELGYAIKTIGWDNIILIFNEAYGNLDDIPFDIKQRRIFRYKLTSGKPKKNERDRLLSDISEILSLMLDRQVNTDRIKTAIKLEVDYQLMEIGNHIYKILHYHQVFISPDDILNMLDMRMDEIEALICKRTPLGFEILKDWSVYIDKLESIKNNAGYSRYLTEEKLVALIKLIEQVRIAENNFMALRFYEPKLNQGKVCKAEDMSVVQRRRQHYGLYQRNDDNCNEIDKGIFYDVKDDDFLTIFQPVKDERAILCLCFREVFNAKAATIDAWGGYIIANPALTRF